MAYEGIFKTKKGIFVRVNNQFKKVKIPQRVYYEDEAGNYKYITGEFRLLKKEFKNNNEKKNFLAQQNSNKKIINYDPSIDYINKHYWKKEIPHPRILYLDIEVIDLNNRKFPQPHLADAPITHIQLQDSKTGKVIILYLEEPSEKIKEKYKNVKFIKCDSEFEMFNYLQKIIKKLNPSIITAYNGNLFDFAYLFFRSFKINFDISLLSPLNDYSFKCEFKNKETGEFKKYYNNMDLFQFLKENKHNLDKWKLIHFNLNLKGLYCLDYLELLKTFTYEDLPSYKLEYVAYKYLNEGEGKVDYGEYASIFEFYEKNYDKFFEYAIQDPIVLYNLEKKLNLINTLTLIAYLMGCNYDVALATVQPWAIHLRHVALKDNIILPNDEKHQLTRPIVGGYVKNPQTGRHEWLISIDFNSLYPSIMDMLNLCASTYIPKEKLPTELLEIVKLFEDEDEEKLLKNKKLQEKIKFLTHKYNVIFNGQGFFRKDKRGIIAQVVAEIYYQRKEEKTKMLLANAILKNKKGSQKLKVNEIITKIENSEINWDNVYDIVIEDIENISELETFANIKRLLQFGLKIMINSLYGAISNTSFILFNRDIAAGITFTGRFLNRYTGEKIAKFLKEKYQIDNAIIYQDTDSAYININKIVNKIIDKKFKKSFKDFNEDEIRKLTDYILKFIDKEIQPLINESVNEIQTMFNAYHKGFVGAKVEKIMYRGIWVAKKKYAVAKIWEEGTYYTNPTLSVTGLDLVKSSTPEFAKKVFKDVLEIMLLKEETDLQNKLKSVKKEFEKIAKTIEGAKQIARISGVNSLAYKQYPDGWYKFVTDENGNIIKKLPAPIQSRASILHNKFVIKNNLEDKFELIEEGNKVNLIYLKVPNYLGNENVIAFQDEKFLEYSKLIDYIDIETQYEKVIEQPIKIMSNALNWELKQVSSLKGLF